MAPLSAAEAAERVEALLSDLRAQKTEAALRPRQRAGRPQTSDTKRKIAEGVREHRASTSPHRSNPVAAWRHSHGHTVAQAAALANVSPSTWRAAEAGIPIGDRSRSRIEVVIS